MLADQAAQRGDVNAVRSHRHGDDAQRGKASNHLQRNHVGDLVDEDDAVQIEHHGQCVVQALSGAGGQHEIVTSDH